jgi:hypothetical protein
VNDATLIVIAAIGAAAAGVGTVVGALNRVESVNAVTLTTRNDDLEAENTELYAWKLTARPYIVKLIGRILDLGHNPPPPPPQLGLTMKGESNGE